MDEIAGRIQQLAGRETPPRGVDTEFRAASLLADSRPDLASAFFRRGLARLREYPETSPTRWVANAVFAFEPADEAEKIILSLGKPRAYAALTGYYVAHKQWGRLRAVLKKILLDDGPAVGNVPWALDKLIPADPAAAADLYFDVKANPTLATKYRSVVEWAPVYFSQGLASAIRDHPEAVHSTLERLLPLFEDEKFLAGTGVRVTTRVALGRAEWQTKSTRETVLLRLGAAAHTADPELYKKYEPLFDHGLGAVRTVEDAIAIADGPSVYGEPVAAEVNFDKLPWPEAVAEWRKLPQLRRRMSVGVKLARRADVAVEQRRLAIEEMLKALGSTQDAEERGLYAEWLLWAASDSHMDRGMTRAVAAEFLAASEATGRHPEWFDHVAETILEQHLDLGEKNPSIQSRIALLQLAEIVSPSYSFTLPSLDGGTVTLKDLKGKIVMLDFWATWCIPCRAEMPMLQKAYAELRDKGFVILAISDEEPDVIKRYRTESGVKFPMLVDERRIVFDHYEIQGIPAAKMIDREGRLMPGQSVMDDSDLRKLVNRLE